MQNDDIIHPPSDQKALEWIAALGSAGVPYRLSRHGSRWLLIVPAGQRDRAWETITAMEEANRGWPPRPVRWDDAPAQAKPIKSGLWGAGFLLLVFICFGPYQSGIAWLRAGAADSTAIVAGQWWRVITALTLHAGFAHLASNMVFLIFIGGAVCRVFGLGMGWALIVASGAAGNGLLAALAAEQHIGVGASTGCFGALGILSMHQAAENLRRFGNWRSVWSRAWIPLLGGLALLGFLGADPNSDVAAHAFGFLCGLLVGVPCSIPRTRRVNALAQDLLKVGTVLLILFAWRSAIHFAT